MANQADPRSFVERYEALKRMWFAPRSRQVDSDGDEIPSALPGREELVQMFKQMGCDIPLSPNDPPRLLDQE